MESEVPKKRERGWWLKEATPEQRAEIARKGGLTTSADRAHMAEIGKKGGSKTSQDRAHMSEIASKPRGPRRSQEGQA